VPSIASRSIILVGWDGRAAAEGAGVNSAESGRFPLMLALETGREALVAAVLKYEPDVKVMEAACLSPLVSAINAGWSLPMVERLVGLGADVNGLGQWGCTPPFGAASRGARDILATIQRIQGCP
jgi:hypothetical protein